MPSEQPKPSSDSREQISTPKSKYEGKETSPGYWVFTPKPGESLPILKEPVGGSDSFISKLARRDEARLIREVIIRGRNKDETGRLEEEALLPSNVRLIEIRLDDSTTTIGAALDALFERGYKLCGDRWWNEFLMLPSHEANPTDDDRALMYLHQALSRRNQARVVSASAWEVALNSDSDKANEPQKKGRVAATFDSLDYTRSTMFPVDLDGTLDTGRDDIKTLYVACIDQQQDKSRFRRHF